MDDPASRPRLSFAAALDTIAALSGREGRETIPLATALHRVTAAPVAAACDYPRFDMSAMDGVALRSSDTAGAMPSAPVLLPIVGEARAGASRPNIPPGSACRISTGAAMPDGLDTVLAKEVARVEGAQVELRGALPAGHNVRRRGEDAKAGDTVIPSGRVLTAAELGALACYGVSAIEAVRLPRIALLSTGDEVAYAGTTPDDHQIFDANGVMIAAIAQSLGLPIERHAPAIDDRVAIRETLRRAADGGSSIVISSGGVSAGDHDHLPDALRDLDATIHFHGVAMRPGKPVLFATFPNGTLFFGLPGNPVAALLGCRFFVVAAIRTRLGLQPERGEAADLDLLAKTGTTLLLKARRHRAHGEWLVDILADQRSHTMRPLIEANCWVRVEEDGGRARCSLYPLLPVLRDTDG